MVPNQVEIVTVTTNDPEKSESGGAGEKMSPDVGYRGLEKLWGSNVEKR